MIGERASEGEQTPKTTIMIPSPVGFKRKGVAALVCSQSWCSSATVVNDCRDCGDGCCCAGCASLRARQLLLRMASGASCLGSTRGEAAML